MELTMLTFGLATTAVTLAAGYSVVSFLWFGDLVSPAVMRCFLRLRGAPDAFLQTESDLITARRTQDTWHAAAGGRRPPTPYEAAVGLELKRRLERVGGDSAGQRGSE